MKRPRREAGGGEVALMAVITKAMGAFLILVVIMLPHYVLSVSSSKTADQAQERADSASKSANEIADALKKGRLTDKEIDELLRKIEALKKELKTLKDEIAQLKNELNQALAEVDRLKKAKEELETEVARLRKELEELKRSVRPSTQIVASWADCPGSDFDLYVWSDAKGQAGTGEKSQEQPPVERKSQSTFWPGEAKSTLASGGFRDQGSIWWRMPESADKETIFVWVKLRNPITTPKSKERECRGNVAATSSRGRTVEDLFLARDASPFAATLILELGTDGSLEPKKPSEKSSQKLFDDLMASPCEALMCFSNGKPTPDVDVDKLKSAFASYISAQLPGHDEVARAVFDQMASGIITIGDGYRLLRPLSMYLPKGTTSNTPDDIANASKLLKQKAAPPLVEQEYLAALSDGRLAAYSLSILLDKIADAASNQKKPEVKPAPVFTPRQLEPDIMSEPPH